MCKMNKKLEEKLIIEIIKLNKKLEDKSLLELSEILGNTKKMITRNFFSGIFKGIGSGIGFSVVTALIIYLIQKIIRLNIPVISKYISDIVDIIQKTK